MTPEELLGDLRTHLCHTNPAYALSACNLMVRLSSPERRPHPLLPWCQFVLVVPCDPSCALEHVVQVDVFESIVDLRDVGELAVCSTSLPLHLVERSLLRPAVEDTRDVLRGVVDFRVLEDLQVRDVDYVLDLRCRLPR